MKQRCYFITPSWLVALYSMYEETSHVVEPVLRVWSFWRSIHRAQLHGISWHQIPRLQVQTLTTVFHIEFRLKFLIRLITLIEQFKTIVVIPQLDRATNGHWSPMALIL